VAFVVKITSSALSCGKEEEYSLLYSESKPCA